MQGGGSIGIKYNSRRYCADKGLPKCPNKLPSSKLAEGYEGILRILKPVSIYDKRTKDVMSKLRQRLQSTNDWDWTEKDTKNYMLFKEWAVKECKAGVKRLVKEDQTKPNALVLVSDWSTEGCFSPGEYGTRGSAAIISGRE